MPLHSEIPRRSPFDSFMAQRSSLAPEEAPKRGFDWEAALTALAGGLSAPPRQGTMGGITAGLSGALGGYMGLRRQRHEDERQEVQDAARMRLAESAITENEAQTRAADALARRRDAGPGPVSQPKPRPTIEEIEAEAEAKARGRARGQAAIPRPTKTKGVGRKSVRRRIPSRGGVSEADYLDEIRESTDIKELTNYWRGLGEADSEEIRNVARRRLSEIQAGGR